MRAALRNQWAGLLALFLVLAGGGAYAAFDPIGSDGDVDACFERRSGDLDIRKGKKCGKGEKPVTWSAEGPRGPQGETGARGEPGAQGQPGTPGTQGPAGSPSAGMLLGWINTAELPGAGGQSSYAPVGDARASFGSVTTTPSAPVVVRDFAVRTNAPPGLGASWVFTLQGQGAQDKISCEVLSVVDRDCDTGGQTLTLPPGANSFRLLVENRGGATPSFTTYAYRATTP